MATFRIERWSMIRITCNFNMIIHCNVYRRLLETMSYLTSCIMSKTCIMAFHNFGFYIKLKIFTIKKYAILSRDFMRNFAYFFSFIDSSHSFWKSPDRSTKNYKWDRKPGSYIILLFTHCSMFLGSVMVIQSNSF